MKNLLVLVLLFMASSAYGEVYRWKDSAGVLHFSNSLDDVPARYQSKVKAMNYGGERKGESPSAQAATVPPATSSQVEKPPQMSTAGTDPAQKQPLTRRQNRRQGRSRVTDE